MRRRSAVLGRLRSPSALASAGLAALVLTGTLARPVPSSAGGGPASTPGASLGGRPPEEWTAAFTTLVADQSWWALDRELSSLQQARRDLYAAFGLGYLHARAKLEAGDLAGARRALETFLAPKHPLRDLALYHRARIAQAQGDREAAARDLEELAFAYPKATYRNRAVEALAERLTGDSAALMALADRLSGTLSAATRRQLEASIVLALLAEDRRAEAASRGVRLLREQGGDDAAESVAAALARPDVLDRLTAPDCVALGEALRTQRHFSRAIPVLRRALPALREEQAELQFSIGRSYFGAEQFASAENVYTAAAKAVGDGEKRAALLYHAARCAELLGDDRRAEQYLGDAIRSSREARTRRRRGPTRSQRRSTLVSQTPRMALALLDRMRLRLAARRFADAEADLRLIEARFAETESALEAGVAYAVVMVSAGREPAARSELETLDSAKRATLDRAEIDYWLGRALERTDPRAAVDAFRRVLEAPGTPFARFARRRLSGPLLPAVRKEVRRLEDELGRLLEADDVDGARRLQTALALLPSDQDRTVGLGRLRDLYFELPAYRDVLELQPPSFPRLPLPEADRLDAGQVAFNGRWRGRLLLSLGLFDEAADVIGDVYPSGAMASGLARAEALRRAGATRRSIAAAEGVLGTLPADFLPDLRPPLLRQLLHPAYYLQPVDAEARANGVDGFLLFAIIREESRFDPRARSGAGARGILQLVLPTARAWAERLDVPDLSAEDLYEPEIALALGARYLAELLRQQGGDVYKALAAYNAGPRQAALWSRLAPGPGDDVFFSSITFDETRAYVGRVLGSHETYRAMAGSPVP